MRCDKCNTEYDSPYCTSIRCLTKEVLEVRPNPKGGYLTFFEGSKYPAPFYPKQDDLNYVDTLKRVIIASARLITYLPITPKRLIKGIKVWLGEIYSADSYQMPGRFKQEDYSEAAQEVLRALIASEESEYIGWCYYLTAIWNTDQAYGLRGKEVFQNLNKAELQKHPRRAIMKLADLLISREVLPYGADQLKKDRMFKKLLWIALWSKEIKRQIVDFFTELDLEKMQFTVEERYWLANKFDYNYEGKSFEERMAWKAEEDKTFSPPKKEKQKPQIAIQPSKEFYELSEQEARNMTTDAMKSLMDNWKANYDNKTEKSS